MALACSTVLILCGSFRYRHTFLFAVTKRALIGSVRLVLQSEQTSPHPAEQRTSCLRLQGWREARAEVSANGGQGQNSGGGRKTEATCVLTGFTRRKSKLSLISVTGGHLPPRRWGDGLAPWMAPFRRDAPGPWERPSLVKPAGGSLERTAPQRSLRGFAMGRFRR